MLFYIRRYGGNPHNGYVVKKQSVFSGGVLHEEITQRYTKKTMISSLGGNTPQAKQGFSRLYRILKNGYRWKYKYLHFYHNTRYYFVE